jgi:serine/threonine protein phosphatase PrpC
MGTTIVAAALENGLVNIAHVGDSRAYRLTGEYLVPLTTDHSWVSELEQSGEYSKDEVAQLANRNVITRALGIHETVEIDFRADPLESGDIYILCSDGLCGYASDEEIMSAVRGCGDDVNKIVDDLIQLANDRGGQDNVTVLAFRIDEIDSQSAMPQFAPVTVSVESDEAILRENQIIDSIVKLRYDTEEAMPLIEEKKKSRALPLLLVFLFIIVVLVAAYFLYLR